MSNFLTSSIGKKVIMSLSGLFLILFLCVHLSVNLLLLVSEEAFNAGLPKLRVTGSNPAYRSIKMNSALSGAIFYFYSTIINHPRLHYDYSLG